MDPSKPSSPWDWLKQLVRRHKPVDESKSESPGTTRATRILPRPGGVFVPATPLKGTTELNQGDVLASAPLLKQGTDENLCTMAGRKNFNWPVPPAEVTAFSGALRVMQAVERVDFALVISNSCDNALGISPIMLAPVLPFTFNPRDDTPGKKWVRVSNAATSTAAPKYFYLPAAKEVGLPRSEAQLGQMYPVTPKLLSKFIALGGTQRVCSLSPDAVVHLQWQIGLIFGRNPREDLAWPSQEDLELKLAWLDEELAKPGKQVPLEDRERYAKEKSAIEQVLGRQSGREGTGSGNGDPPSA